MAAIIFDFDGTIADSFETVVQIFHELTGRKERLSPEAIERLRGMSLPQAAEELGVRPWRMPFLVMVGRRRMGKRIAQVRTHPGVPETVRKLYAEGHQLFIMSSNSEKNIRLFLKQHHMLKEFVSIYGNVGLLSKAGVLRKIRRRNRLGSDTCWYVGDEVRDIEGAKLAGIKVIAVTWGFNTAELLRGHQPTVLVNAPTELLQVLEEA
ncbi:MAG TPA: HAD-IA family hydrolase [Verrucomicrobiae bacterium]|nr:HAD-IA family hydrolase [Verrucomicrobiae bacterium]